MTIENQGAQVVKNSARLIIAGLENDESNTVDNDEQFEIPLVEVESLARPAY